MPSSSARRSAQGFTLIELLIVVIILAILAAIVIPQFSNTTADAKDATIDTNLSSIRSAIELYRVQHNNLYPGANPSNNGPACLGVRGTGVGGSAAAAAIAFADQLTAASNVGGDTCTVADANYKFGPYLRQKIPAEPITLGGSNNVTVTLNGIPIAPTGVTPGWAYDTKSGQFVMNSNAVDASGAKPYFQH